MGWAILWGMIIGGTSNNSGVGFLAFIIIWLFVDDRNATIHNATVVINKLQQRIIELESELSIARSAKPKKREKEWNVL